MIYMEKGSNVESTAFSLLANRIVLFNYTSDHTVPNCITGAQVMCIPGLQTEASHDAPRAL